MRVVGGPVSQPRTLTPVELAALADVAPELLAGRPEEVVPFAGRHAAAAGDGVPPWGWPAVVGVLVFVSVMLAFCLAGWVGLWPCPPVGLWR